MFFKEEIALSIKDYMTPNEASYRWGVEREALKERLRPSRNEKQIQEFKDKGLIKSFRRPDGKRNEWIISSEAMEMWYGKEK